MRFDGSGKRKLPHVRRSSKYDLASAVRFCRVLVHTTLAEHHPVAAKAFMRVMQFTRIAKNPTGLFESEIGELRSTVSEMLPLVSTAAWVTPDRCLKNLNRSDNWHKSLHTADSYQHLGPALTSGSDETGEWMQKVCGLAPLSLLSLPTTDAHYLCLVPEQPLVVQLLHRCYRHHSNKWSDGDLLGQIARWLMAYQAVQYGERMLALCNADLVLAAGIG